MKKGWICFLLACHLGMAYGQKNVIDEIVWVVGDEAILLSDVEFQRLYMLFATMPPRLVSQPSVQGWYPASCIPLPII